ncbi:MAG: hypothetical protein Q7S51_03020 [Gallionellaceae bacterium]|nr:hypothetical protein [Gallionellaceae bacterium]
MKFRAYQFVLAIFVLIPLSAGAETIYLKDGSTITGKIMNVGPEEVVISTVVGEITIEGAKILRVDGVAATSEVSSTPEASPIKSYSDLHMQQKNGLGFGPSISSMLGMTLFYDRNLSSKSQLHVQLIGSASSRSNFWGEQLIKANRSMLLTTYRYFPAENKGFYVGAGGGLANSTLTYNSSVLSGSTPYKYTSHLKGVFVLGEVGWQGKDGYYFNVGLQPAAYISSSDNYDANNIPNTSNHRSSANEEHDKLKTLSQISIGFGWFF